MREFAQALLMTALDQYQRADSMRAGIFTEDELSDGRGMASWMLWCNEWGEGRIRELEDLGDVYVSFFFKIMGVETESLFLTR